MAEEAIPVPTASRPVHYPALDGLRAFAVTAVFLWHYLHIRWGWMGVDAFFALSGFLITGILYDTRHRAHRFRNFYIRRTLRIFPLYYTVLVLLFVLGFWLHWQWNPGLPLYFLYLGNFNSFLFRHQPQVAATQSFLSSTITPLTLFLGHFWSLCLEEQFYLVWPLLVFTVRNRKRLMQICIAGIVIEPLLRLITLYTIHTADVHDIISWSTPLRLDALLLGALLALYLRGPKPVSLHKPAAAISIAGFVVLYLWHVPLDTFLQTPGQLVWVVTAGFSLVALIGVALIVLALQPGTILYRILCWRPLREIGKVSYGIYVFHDIPHSGYEGFLDGFNIDDPRAVALFAAFCTLVLAFASYYGFERFFLKWKDRYTR